MQTEEEAQAQLAMDQKRAAARLARQTAEEANEENTGFFGKIADNVSSFLADKWTDDFSAIPVVGPTARVAGEGLQQTWDGTYTLGSMAALAPNRGYWENRPDDGSFWGDFRGDAENTNVGVAVSALNEYYSQPINNLFDNAGPLDKNIYIDNPGLNIANPQEQKAAFTGRTDLNIQSGVVSGLYGWFLDPLIIVGKSKKIFTVGTRAGGLDIVGRKRVIRDQQGISEKVFKSIDTDADEAIDFYAKGVGRNSRLGVIGEMVAQRDFESLRKINTFKGANRDVLASIGASISNTQDAIVFVAAAAGSAKYQKILEKTQAATALSLKRAASKTNEYETRTLNIPSGAVDVPVLDNYLEPGVDATEVIRDLLKRDDALRAALLSIDDMPTGMINQLGGQTVTGMKIAKAWRDGVLARKRLLKETIDPTDFSTTRNLASTKRIASDYKISSKEGVAPAAFETIYQISGAMPRVAVIDWIKGSNPTGWIDIRGLSSGKASDELDAAFSNTKILSKDRIWVSEQKAIFGAAQGPMQKFEAIKTIERNAFIRLAKEEGLNDPKAIKEIYDLIDNRRSQLVDNFKQRNFGISPDDGTTMIMTPMMKTQLETLMPMLNMRNIEKSAKLMARQAKYATDVKIPRSGNIIKTSIDEILSLWKAGALLRLGYTVRNTVEGTARSAVYLGTVPGADQLLSTAGRSVFNNSRRIEGRLPALWRSDSTKLIGTKALLKEEKRALDTLNGISKEIAEGIDDLSELAAKEKSVRELRLSLDNLAARRERLGERKFLGDNEAFSGEWGDLYRRLSSAERTNSQFLNSRYMRMNNEMLNGNNWGKIKPTDPQYWDELSNAIRQFRGDDIALRLLNGESIGSIVKWAKSPQARSYRRDMNLAKEAVERRVVYLDDSIKTYLPTPKVRDLARVGEVKPSVLRSQLSSLSQRKSAPTKPKVEFDTDPAKIEKTRKKYEKALAAWKKEQAGKPTLSDIHGRKLAQEFEPTKYSKYVDKPIEKLFRTLGTYPESVMVRHPFYNEVWKRNMIQLQQIAKAQGRIVDDASLAKMNTSAHKTAMQATNETLFTIERYSNPAAAMRWASPFFAAWENSAKVWTKMVVNDPSVLARANMLWNIPENLGMIVDREGNKVEGSALDFLKGSQDQYLTLPSFLADAVSGKTGGTDVRIPRGSLNVISPGETSWLPGFGPVVIYPVGKLLAQMPGVQGIVRDAVGDQLYNQIAPFGRVNDGLLRNFAPSWLRQEIIRFQGESNSDYVKTTNAMMQIAMINWYKSGGIPEDKPDMDKVLQMTNDFYRFSSIARLTLPFSTSRSSPYQIQVDEWNNLKADPSLTYREKLDSFIDSWGEDFMPITVSGSDATVPGIQSTQEVYKTITKHSGLARELAQTSAEAVGILASSAPVGEFDQGVYKWMSDNDVPGLDRPYRGTKTPNQMSDDIVMAQAWRDYRAAKDARDEYMAANGIKSINSKKARGVKKIWDNFKYQMVEKYQSEWVENFNGWQDETASNLSAITKVLNNEKFMKEMGSTPRWEGIQTYMAVRQQAIDAIDSGEVESAKVKEVFANWINQYKFSSLEFNDFYERYLEQDELLRYGIGFLND